MHINPPNPPTFHKPTHTLKNISSKMSLNMNNIQHKQLLSHFQLLLQVSITLLFIFYIFFHFLSSVLLTRMSVSFIWCSFISILCYFRTHRTKPVYLLNYSCFKPDALRKCTYQTCHKFVYSCSKLSTESISFMRRIYLKSGLGDETYAPPFIFQDEELMNMKSGAPKFEPSMDEAREGIFSTVDSLIEKTGINVEVIDTLIITSGCFSPTPSLSSLIMNRYQLRHDVKTYNLSGMGCSSGVLSIDLAAKLLREKSGISYALVIVTEIISSNWYLGEDRSMLVTNCIFRVGCASLILTNDRNRRRDAKMELVNSLRTHHGADDSAYNAAIQKEDEKGYTGISLTKDLIRVAGVNLRSHIKQLAPRVLPLSQLASYGYSLVMAAISRTGEMKPIVPDFTTAFEHVCIHTGGKAVIDQVARVLKLNDNVTEPARMCLHRFGNTSSSLVFYELAYFEAKKRMKSGDRMWMIAFGTGFKVGSLVWKWLDVHTENECDTDNPWHDCIDNYPLEIKASGCFKLS